MDQKDEDEDMVKEEDMNEKKNQGEYVEESDPEKELSF